jgi:3-oxoacyl-[acyl-carrier-protein] synthase II
MPFDTPSPPVVLVGSAVYRPGQEHRVLTRQEPASPVTLDYKTVGEALNRKGLRYKDEATLLALMVTQRLLSGLPVRTQDLNDATAVIVSSNFGNIDTVVENARIIETRHVDATSAMALPNASSNAVSATVSIVNQLRGVNLMLCNGEESGLDGFTLARQLLASRRARQVLLIGVELTNEAVETLFGPAGDKRFHGAAAVLLGCPEDAGAGALQLCPADTAASVPLGRGDTEALTGPASGAEGVLRLVLAAERAAAAQGPVALADGPRLWELRP